MISNPRRDITPSSKRFSYKIGKFAGIDAESDDSSLSLNYATNAYNIGFINGTLVNGIGIDEPIIYPVSETIPREIPSMKYFSAFIEQSYIYNRYDYENEVRDDRFIVFDKNRLFYQAKVADGEFAKITYGTSALSKVNCINYHLNGKDVFLMYLRSGELLIFDGSKMEHHTEGIPKMNSVCTHYERIYGTGIEGNKLYFSDDLNPINWKVSNTEGGYITFPDEGGELKKVLSFKDNLYIFRERCIHRMTAYADPTDYKVVKVYSCNNKIVENSIAICDDKIVFLTDDGLYSFDGYNAVKIFNNLTPLIDVSHYAVSSYFNRKYYLAIRLKTLDNKVIADEIGQPKRNNGMLILDMYTGNVSIFRGSEINGFLIVNTTHSSNLAVTFGNFRASNFGIISDSGQIFKEPLPKLWQSASSYINELDRDKVLKRIYITSFNPVKIIVKGTSKTQEKQVYSSQTPQTINLALPTTKIAMEIRTDEDKLYIPSLQLDFNLTRRYYADRINY